MRSLRAAAFAVIVATARADHDACTVNLEAPGPTLTALHIVGRAGTPAACSLPAWYFEDDSPGIYDAAGGLVYPTPDELSAMDDACRAHTDECACQPFMCDPYYHGINHCEWDSGTEPCLVEEASGVITVSSGLSIDGDDFDDPTVFTHIDLSGLASVPDKMRIRGFPNVASINFGPLEVGEDLKIGNMSSVLNIEYAGATTEEVDISDMPNLVSASFPNAGPTSLEFENCPSLASVSAPDLVPRPWGCSSWIRDGDFNMTADEVQTYMSECTSFGEDEHSCHEHQMQGDNAGGSPCTFEEQSPSIRIEGSMHLESLATTMPCGCDAPTTGDCCEDWFATLTECTVPEPAPNSTMVCPVSTMPGINIGFAVEWQDGDCDWDSLDCGYGPGPDVVNLEEGDGTEDPGHDHGPTCNFGDLMRQLRDVIDGNSDFATLAGDPTFTACQHVAQQIDDAHIASSCP